MRFPDLHFSTVSHPVESEVRKKEIQFCAEQVQSGALFESVIFFCEKGITPDFVHQDSKLVHLDKRLTYADWIRWCAERDLEDVIFVLANSDIFFDESVSKLKEICSEATAVCLSRYEYNGSITAAKPHPNPHWSQDVWAVHSSSLPKLINRIALFEFWMGVPRCDNKFAYALLESALQISNPFPQVKSFHNHSSQVRGYSKTADDTIIGPVAYVHPAVSGETSELEIDIWLSEEVNVAKCSPNFSLSKWRTEATLNAEKSSIVPTYESPLSPGKLPLTAEVIREGNIVFSAPFFKIIGFENECFSWYFGAPLLQSENIGAFEAFPSKRKLALTALQSLPHVLSHPDYVSIREGKHDDSAVIWQFPCNTEEVACSSIKDINLNVRGNFELGIYELYLAVPWASLIDLKSESHGSFAALKATLSVYRSLAQEAGITLRVHTVCQHIRWRNVIDWCRGLGITDLHASHATKNDVEEFLGSDLKLHGWTLVAVNKETPERSKKFEVVPFDQRRYLCSFKGSHMGHYLDSSRLSLGELPWPDNCIVEITEKWHFNDAVYKSQIHGDFNLEANLGDLSGAESYNDLLCQSKFALCPVGAGPNTLRFWEAIAAGAVPVLFNDDLAIFNKSEIYQNLLSNCIVWRKPISNDFIDFLETYDLARAQRQSENLVELYDQIRVPLAKTNHLPGQ